MRSVRAPSAFAYSGSIGAANPTNTGCAGTCGNPGPLQPARRHLVTPAARLAAAIELLSAVECEAAQAGRCGCQRFLSGSPLHRIGGPAGRLRSGLACVAHAPPPGMVACARVERGSRMHACSRGVAAARGLGADRRRAVLLRRPIRTGIPAARGAAGAASARRPHARSSRDARGCAAGDAGLDSATLARPVRDRSGGGDASLGAARAARSPRQSAEGHAGGSACGAACGRAGSEPTPLSPWGLRLPCRRAGDDGPAFQSGLVEIQDEGSQLVAALVDARPEMRVADWCAGAGGKTLALAMMMRQPGAHRWRATCPRRGSMARFAGCGEPACTTWSGISSRPATSWPSAAPAASSACLWMRHAPAAARGGATPTRFCACARPTLRHCFASRRHFGSGRATGSHRRPFGLRYLFVADRGERGPGVRLPVAPGRFRPFTARAGLAAGGRAPCVGRFLSLTPLRHGTDGFFGAVLERRT